MQDYFDIAAKNGVTLIGVGSCQFCGAKTERGIHECVELFSHIAYQAINYSKPENHLFRFISVDAHTLQHPEIHGRWNNHFHLTRQHLMFHYEIEWNYDLSPKLSHHLNVYKIRNSEEILDPPTIFNRGKITTTEVLKNKESDCMELIIQWGNEVYHSWSKYHSIVDKIAHEFIKVEKYRL